MRRFEAARSLDFVPAKDLGVCDDDNFRFLAKKSAGKRAQISLQLLRSFARRSRDLQFARSIRDAWIQSFKTIFAPNLGEPLALAIVVAKELHRVTLPQPAVELIEKFPALDFGNLRLGRPLGQRPEGVEGGKVRSAKLPLRKLILRRRAGTMRSRQLLLVVHDLIAGLQQRHSFGNSLLLKLAPQA